MVGLLSEKAVALKDFIFKRRSLSLFDSSYSSKALLVAAGEGDAGVLVVTLVIVGVEALEEAF